MTPTLIDTDVLSYFLRGQWPVVQRVQEYLHTYERLNLSIVTYYEILSGLRHKDAARQLDRFLELVRHNIMLPLTTASCDLSATLYAQLRQQGETVDDIDLLIAGIALEHGLAVATHNLGHFRRIPGLVVQDWTLDDDR